MTERVVDIDVDMVEERDVRDPRQLRRSTPPRQMRPSMIPLPHFSDYVPRSSELLEDSSSTTFMFDSEATENVRDINETRFKSNNTNMKEKLQLFCLRNNVGYGSIEGKYFEHWYHLIF